MTGFARGFRDSTGMLINVTGIEENRRFVMLMSLESRANISQQSFSFASIHASSSYTSDLVKLQTVCDGLTTDISVKCDSESSLRTFR